MKQSKVRETNVYPTADIYSVIHYFVRVVQGRVGVVLTVLKLSPVLGAATFNNLLIHFTSTSQYKAPQGGTNL